MSEQRSVLDARDDLLAVADAWPDLLDRLGQEGRAGGEKVKGTKTPGLVINENVSKALSELTAWVHFLARVLVDEVTVETRWTEPGEDGKPVERIRVDPWAPPRGMDTPTLLAHIARDRIGHFTAHPDEMLRMAFFDDARAMRSLAERAAYPSGRRWIPLHIACLEHGTSDKGERVVCPGQYRALLDPEKPGLIPDMVCEADPTHRISPLDWQRAARKSGFDPERMRERLAVARGVVA